MHPVASSIVSAEITPRGWFHAASRLMGGAGTSSAALLGRVCLQYQ
jgi:hypothetical protein